MEFKRKCASRWYIAEKMILKHLGYKKFMDWKQIDMEYLGIDPSTSRMLSERSTI